MLCSRKLQRHAIMFHVTRFQLHGLTANGAIVSCSVHNAQDDKKAAIVNVTASGREGYLMDGEKGEHGNEAIPIRDLPSHTQCIWVLPL